MTVACQERILLVENDEDVAVVMKARLESAGYDVHTETYGAAALGYAAQQLVDLVILDVQLPDLSGYEVCQELRQLCPRSDITLSVLVFTGSQGPQGMVDEISAMVSGADAYLTKRCDPSELMTLVDQLLHQPELRPASSRF